MTSRELSARLVALLIDAAALLLAVLYALAIELADEINASRNERRTANRLRGNHMSTKNVRLYDSTTQLRAANAKLAAVVGDQSRAAATLSDARQLAAELAQPVRRAS